MFDKLILAIIVLMAPFAAMGESHPSGGHAAAEAGNAGTGRTYLREILAQQDVYRAGKNAVFFRKLAKGQKPRATVVTCSDSRVHSNMWDLTPEGDMFVIRNIGNQLVTSMGSVQYGVDHLNSSLLLIIGHARCGAIAAASSDYSDLEPAIKKELDTIAIEPGKASIYSVRANVNNQVRAAVNTWRDKVASGELLVVGAVYDFANDMRKGAGKLNVININDEDDPAKLRNMEATRPAAAAAHKAPASH